MVDKDIRYQRTKKNILKAMTSLLSETSFEQITVKTICERAKISRSGFYLHYTDKYDLIEKYQLDLTGQGLDLFAENVSKTKYEVLLGILKLFKNEGQLLGLLISSNGPTEIQVKVKQMMRENARQNMLPNITIKLENELQEKYFLTFMSNAIFGVLQEWIDSGQKESPEELVRILDAMLTFDFVD